MRDFTSEYNRKYFGANLKKAKANYDKEMKRARNEFVKKYPYAKISKFKFWVLISKNGEISGPTAIYYIDETDGTNWEINSIAFDDFYSSALYWGLSKIWDPSNYSPTLKLGGSVENFPFDLNHFRIFVNGERSFSFQTTPLNTKWVNSKNASDI